MLPDPVFKYPPFPREGIPDVVFWCNEGVVPDVPLRNLNHPGYLVLTVPVDPSEAKRGAGEGEEGFRRGNASGWQFQGAPYISGKTSVFYARDRQGSGDCA